MIDEKLAALWGGFFVAIFTQYAHHIVSILVVRFEEQMIETGFKLIASEPDQLFEPTSCRLIKFKTLANGRVYALAEMNPILHFKLTSISAAVPRAVLASRHEGQQIDCVDEFPFHVHVAFPQGDVAAEIDDDYNISELRSVGWATIEPED